MSFEVKAEDRLVTWLELTWQLIVLTVDIVGVHLSSQAITCNSRGWEKLTYFFIILFLFSGLFSVLHSWPVVPASVLGCSSLHWL